MLALASLSPGQLLHGVEPAGTVTVIAVIPIGPDACKLVFERPNGAGYGERLVTVADAATFTLADAARPWTFDADGASFKLAVEATRIDLAFLFDPMLAVHTSNVEPLPHQITAVYESMLPRQPLRFVLADDPGAGKTIMAGLYLREMLARADAERVCIVAPGSLVDQWRDELFEKFGLEFRVFSNELAAGAAGGNPFEHQRLWIVRLDQLSRSDELAALACKVPWDLVIFDEAHKLSAHFMGQEIKKTGRFRLAEALGAVTRHLLLMTATPHNGKEEDFQLFLSLLDSDRFFGRFRDGVHKVEVDDLMRRMVKEELLRFDGTPLFPERRAGARAPRGRGERAGARVQGEGVGVSTAARNPPPRGAWLALAAALLGVVALGCAAPLAQYDQWYERAAPRYYEPTEDPLMFVYDVDAAASTYDLWYDDKNLIGTMSFNSGPTPQRHFYAYGQKVGADYIVVASGKTGEETYSGTQTVYDRITSTVRDGSGLSIGSVETAVPRQQAYSYTVERFDYAVWFFRSDDRRYALWEYTRDAVDLAGR